MHSASDNPPLVEFRGVSYHAPGLAAPILDGPDCHVQRGETLVLLGASGVGGGFRAGVGRSYTNSK